VRFGAEACGKSSQRLMTANAGGRGSCTTGQIERNSGEIRWEKGRLAIGCAAIGDTPEDLVTPGS